ncbi:MAG: molecular chaperone HtpG [Bacteroidales bacterium]|nr:molecular chaperone HtpG [Bacteroidales bacterium]
MQKGTIGVTTDNIFPVIKKFLYSDHEIFLRELVSNAVDATQKLRTLSSFGEYKGELGDLDVTVTVDKEKGTLTVTDRGIGMTAEDIDKYINQIAFSGAEEFLAKYKDSANTIIGHFGLGFYSAFMVSSKVEIRSLSYKEGAKGVMWSCDGSPEFEMGDCDKTDRGTEITLYIDDDNKEFLEQTRIDTLLKKYCRFLPVPVRSGDKVINDTAPQWTKKPSELTDDDYRNFYHELYPGQDDPLFWIHLNVDYPFHLTGILYFPKVKSNLDLQRNKIQLYSNQVFVTDHVEGIVPDFLTLLHGVIDSPDIPLNVSRSYLQSDSNVKKISTYIEKKVADRLQGIFKSDRKEFEEKWDDIKLFINYGMLSEPETFYDRAKDFALMKDTEGKYYSFEEYRKLIEGNQTDKDKVVVYLYATNKEDQYTYIEAAKSKGYSVLMLDGQLDVPVISLLEQKFSQSRFVRVDSDIIDRLIVKDDAPKSTLTDDERDILSQVFRSQMPAMEKKEFGVEVSNLGENAQPVVLTENEYMRRMKDISKYQQGTSFYGQMPDTYTVVLNADHKLVKKVLDEERAATEGELKPVSSELKGQQARLAALHQSQSKKKAEEITKEEKDDLQNTEKAVNDLRQKKNDIIAAHAKDNKVVHELIDLALLQNGMLKGKALDAFLKRSVDMIG